MSQEKNVSPIASASRGEKRKQDGDDLDSGPHTVQKMSTPEDLSTGGRPQITSSKKEEDAGDVLMKSHKNLSLLDVSETQSQHLEEPLTHSSRPLFTSPVNCPRLRILLDNDSPPCAGPSRPPHQDHLDGESIPSERVESTASRTTSANILPPALPLLVSQSDQKNATPPSPKESVIYQEALPPSWIARTGGKEITTTDKIVERSRTDPNVRQVFFSHETGK